MGLSIFVSNYSGSLNDQVTNFLLDNTTGTDSSWSCNDLWMRFFEENGATGGTLNDRTVQFLATYLSQPVGAIDDMWGLVTEPYSGNTPQVNVFENYDLTNWGVSSLVTSRTKTSFTVSGNGGVYSVGSLTVGKNYTLTAEVNTTAPSGLSIRNAATADAQAPQIGNAPTTAGAHTITGTFTAVDTGIYIRQVGAGTTTVTSLTAYEQPPNPLTTVNTIWLYGASIEDGVSKVGDLTDYTPALSNYISNLVGRAITVVDKGVPSQTMDMILARFNADDLAAATALGNQLLIMSMPMGNDISISRPYPGGAVGISSDYEALMAAFLGSGAYVLPSTATFRNYGGTSVMNEANGSLPYNTDIFEPYIKAMGQFMWDGLADRPYNDPYNFARNWYSHVLADEVHYTNEGYRILGRYWLDVAAARILGQWPTQIARVADPTASQVRPALATGWKAATGSGYSVYSQIMGFMTRGVFSTQVDGLCVPMEGYAPNAITCTHFSVTGGASDNTTNLDTGNTSNTLLNDKCKAVAFPRDSGTFLKVCEWKGLAPGQPFEVDILSCRYVTTADPARITEFSFDGTTVAGECLSAYTTATKGDIALLTLSGTADGSGKVAIWFRRKTGSTFGYINGAVIRPL